MSAQWNSPQRTPLLPRPYRHVSQHPMRFLLQHLHKSSQISVFRHHNLYLVAPFVLSNLTAPTDRFAQGTKSRFLLFRLQGMAGNNIVWLPQVMEDMLRCYKEKIQAEGKLLIFREVHHEECAKQINEKYQTNFTQRQVYHKYHKLKGQWKVILQAKNLSGANFDDVKKMILYDETEVVRMQNEKDPRAKFINVPIHCYDETEFIFQDKHATGEFTVLQAPYDLPFTQDEDLIGDKNVNHGEDVDLGLQYDSDCLVEEDGNNGGSSSSKRLAARKSEKVKRTKRDDSAIPEVTQVLRDMTDTMRFTHVSHPNEELFKTIDAMDEYPLFVRLDLQEYLANNEKTAAMLKGRPLEAIKEYVQRWFPKNYPSPI